MPEILRFTDMGSPNDDVVLIEKGKKRGEASMITINCPDRTGLGCDLCRIILEFGLFITKGVVPRSGSINVRWPSLKERLLSVCPSSTSLSFYLNQQSFRSSPSPLYLLKIYSLDRKGLLHDVTKVLCELELSIERVKVTTTPDGRVMDLFFIKDNLDLLHTESRWNDTCQRMNAILGDSCISCELQLAGPEYEAVQQGVSTLSPAIAEELFCCELAGSENQSCALSPDLTRVKQASVMIDNSLSPAHTLVQIHCIDQKGLLYDVMRTLKDCNFQIAYGRFSAICKGSRDVDLFIQQIDGNKIVDPEKQSVLCSRLKMEMLHSLRVAINNRGPDTELLVANPVEFSGNGRPRVFFDVTLALKVLGICIFSAEIGRHSKSDRQWEVYRFLLDETREYPLSSGHARNQIVDKVRRTLMGW